MVAHLIITNLDGDASVPRSSALKGLEDFWPMEVIDLWEIWVPNG